MHMTSYQSCLRFVSFCFLGRSTLVEGLIFRCFNLNTLIDWFNDWNSIQLRTLNSTDCPRVWGELKNGWAKSKNRNNSGTDCPICWNLLCWCVIKNEKDWRCSANCHFLWFCILDIFSIYLASLLSVTCDINVEICQHGTVCKYFYASV